MFPNGALIFFFRLILPLYGYFEQIMETAAPTQFGDIWPKMGNEEKKGAVQEEVKRMNKLPANSAYASHRLRVLNKILQLMSQPVYNNLLMQLFRLSLTYLKFTMLV